MPRTRRQGKGSGIPMLPYGSDPASGRFELPEQFLERWAATEEKLKESSCHGYDDEYCSLHLGVFEKLLVRSGVSPQYGEQCFLFPGALNKHVFTDCAFEERVR